MRARSIKILGVSMNILRRDWREETGGPVLRTLLGKVRAHVRYTGSISQGAKLAGISYKSAWDAINEMNQLADETLVERSEGVIVGRAAVLAEGDASERGNLIYLATLPLFFH